MKTNMEATIIDPLDLLASGHRILIDTSVFLETDPARAGGLTELVVRCEPTITAQRNPLVVLASVKHELLVKSKQRGSDKDARRADKAAMALEFLEDATRDGLVTTEFGDASDHYADHEFEAVAEVADHMGGSICLLTRDDTAKIAVRACGRGAGHEQLAGSLLKDGTIEIESPAVLHRKCSSKRTKLERSGFPGKYDRAEFDRLTRLLPKFRQVHGLDDNSPLITAGATRKPGSEAKAPRQPSESAEPVPFNNPARKKTGDAELPPTSIPTTGDEVRCGSPAGSRTVVLAEEIGGGKEGSVFAIDGDRTKVVKIFKQPFRTKHRLQKVQLLVDKQLRRPGICFPEEVVSNASGDFAGYLMRRAEGGRVLAETITNKPLFKRTYQGWQRDDLVEVCLSFLKRVQDMHALNILVGDINEGNLMVSPNRDVWIIDTDSCQFEGYICPVGWPEFTAPELTNYAGLRTEQHELFAVAMVLFMIIMTGRFAYDRARAPLLEDADEVTRYLIKEGKFPYQFGGQGDRDQPFGDAKYMWSHIHPPVKELFWHTLHRDGDRYRDRPTVAEWIKVFQMYKRSLSTKQGWNDPMSHDVYPIRYKAISSDVTIKDCSGCGYPNGIAGKAWLDADRRVTDERVPALCNRCVPKCDGCGDPDLWGTYRDGLCRTCRQQEDGTSHHEPSDPTITAQAHPATAPAARRPAAAAAATRSVPPQPPRTSTPAAAPRATSRATPGKDSFWQRVRRAFNGD